MVGGVSTAPATQSAALVQQWSRENFTGSAPPRTEPLSNEELSKAAGALENLIIKGSRSPKEAQGLVTAYRDTLKKLTP